jgi:two-component system chemotaxis response regulator CheY
MKRTNTHILVVDHDQDTRDFICGLLHDLGFPAVDEAHDADEAIALFHRNHYDMVITELHLPDCNGLELLRVIRHGAYRHDATVLVLGEAVSPRTVVDILYAGANGFLAKPLVAHTFCAKVVRLVGRLAPDAFVTPNRSDFWVQG